MAPAEPGGRGWAPSYRGTGRRGGGPAYLPAARELQPDDTQPGAEWRFEVLDVRITTGPAGCAPDEAWVAYGTLSSAGRTPLAASYRDGPNGR